MQTNLWNIRSSK